jgi:serine/threonine protein kinase
MRATLEDVTMPAETQVEELLGRWEELRAGGQAPAAEELCRDCPELLSEVARRIAALQAMYGVLTVEGGGPDTEGRAGGSGAAPPAWPEVPGYAVLGQVSQGGMGVVYKALDTRLKRLVALKMIRDGAHARPDMIARFRAEAAAVAQLRHPHIVQIHEVGEHNGHNYLTLEFVNGPTLAQRLAGTPQPSLPAAQLVEMLARAVAVAHQHGIIHRDLKPGNILLALPAAGHNPDNRDGSHAQDLYGIPKIIDFGLAKRLDVGDNESDLTHSGCIVGTPSYMAPEQATGRHGQVGPAVDVYALGVILYEMLTGRPPFQATTPLETVRLVTAEEPTPPRRLQPYVPRDLETICLKCLNKDRRKRYPSALALAEDLRRYTNGEPIQARPPGVVGQVWRWCRRYPVPPSLLLSMVCCLVFGFWYLSRLSDQLVHSAVLESAAQQSDLLLEVNNSYTDVVGRAKAGHLTVTHNYAGKPDAIPIPATFSTPSERKQRRTSSPYTPSRSRIRYFGAASNRPQVRGGDEWHRERGMVRLSHGAALHHL